jgi:NAD(P)-dependent dehydrogenase (short-subunit alcohol dehydrogenase family)
VAEDSIRPVALVTGARRGIGRAAALALARAGFDVAANDLEAGDDLAATVAAVEELGARAAALPADIADIAGHAALLDAVAERLGRLDCLVNNAGVSVLVRGDLLDVSPESFDRCLAVNARGTFFLTQAFARRLVAAPPPEDGVHRAIVTVTSANAEAASVNRGEYCISKAALSMTSRLFALRLAEVGAGVGVYEVRPGFIETEMSAPSKGLYDEHMRRGLTAIRRWGRPEEVAQVIATLASGALPYTVGEAIHVDGGLMIAKY